MNEKSMLFLELKDYDDPVTNFIKEQGWKEIYNPPPRLLSKTRLVLADVVDAIGIPGVAEPESLVDGVEFLRRLRLMGADLGKTDALKVWRQRNQLPKEWQGSLLLTSYLVKDSENHLRHLYFSHDEERGWRWRFGSVHCKFSICCRALIPVNDR